MAFFGRGLNKTQDPYTVIDIYDYYISSINESNIYFVEKREYCDIVYDFYSRIMEAILRENAELKMAFGLGSLRVNKTKVKLNRLNVLSVDWVNTVEQGKHIYHLNEHTNGFKYFFYWNKKKNKIKNQYFYKLVMTRDNKRLLAKLVKSGRYDFFEK